MYHADIIISSYEATEYFKTAFKIILRIIKRYNIDNRSNP